MNKAIATDLVDASDVTEHILKRLPDLSLDEKVDIAARLRAVVKNCMAIDEVVKAEIKKKLKGKEGVVLGDVFKANVKKMISQRLDQKALKNDHLDLYEKYCVDQTTWPVTFEPR
jgi:predicted phage-related endonuclease